MENIDLGNDEVPDFSKKDWMADLVAKKYQMYKPMAEILQPGQEGRFKLDVFDVTEDEVKIMKLRSLFNGNSEYAEFQPGRYVRLTSGFEVVMSDTQMEKATNMDFYDHAHGKVLVGGLGIGMILLAVQDKPEVESIVVVEKFPEVIRLVGSQLPLTDKVQIIEGDIMEWKPEKGTRFDTLYFDIWNTISGDNWEDMVKLKQRFRPYMTPKAGGSWMACWREYDVKRRARSNSNSRYY